MTERMAEWEGGRVQRFSQVPASGDVAESKSITSTTSHARGIEATAAARVYVSPAKYLT